jgi:hypothetical protein
MPAEFQHLAWDDDVFGTAFGGVYGAGDLGDATDVE